MKSARRRSRGILVTVLALMVLLAVWQTASMLIPTQTTLPSPSRVGRATVEMWRSGELLQDVDASLRRVLTGFLLALLAGLLLGVIAARYFRTYKHVAIILELLSSIPPIAWTPLAILWFGIGDAPAFFIVFLGAFFPLFTGVYAGITQAEKKLVDAALTLGASRAKVVFGVVLPSALPSILTGMKTAVGVAWFNVIAAELIGVRSGLGYKIQLSRTLLFSENVVGLMLVIGVLGWVMVHLVAAAGNLVAPWRLDDVSRAKWVAGRTWFTRPLAAFRSRGGRGERPVLPPGTPPQPCRAAIPGRVRRQDEGPILTVSRVSKSFPTEEGTLDVLQDVSFSVYPGEVFTIVGPNGSGKTTLIRVIAGLDEPVAGSVTFQGKPVAGPDRSRAVIFQDFALFPWRTASGNIEFALGPSNRTTQGRDEVAALLEEAALEQFRTTYPADLSGGMKQRLAVVRAIAAKPDLILMDEPFASLDPLVRESSQQAILSLLESRPITVILVTHDLDEAVTMSDRVLVLSPRPGRVKRIVPVRPEGRHDPELRKSVPPHALRTQLWELLRAPMDEQYGVSPGTREGEYEVL